MPQLSHNKNARTRGQPVGFTHMKKVTSKKPKAMTTKLTYQEEWLGDDAYQDEAGYGDEAYLEEGCLEEAYEGCDDETFEKEDGYDDEAYEGYDDEAYGQEEDYDDEADEGYGNKASEQEEGYADEAEGYDKTYEQEECYETYEDETGQRGQCMFFASPQVCRSGDACKYRHDCDPNTGETLPALSRNRRWFRWARRCEPGPEASYRNLPT